MGMGICGYSHMGWNGNDFKPMGIPTCGLLWVSMGFSVVFLWGFLWVLWVFVGVPTEILWEWDEY